MTLLTAWSPFFQSSVRIQGRSLQLGAQVAREEPQEGELVRAAITDRTPQQVIARAEGRNAIIECDCNHYASGQFCRHIWALLLDMERTGDGPGASLSELIKLRLRPPKARKRDEAPRPIQSAEPQWMGRLSLLRPPGSELENSDGNLFPIQRQICYVVMPRLSTRHNGVVIDLRQRTAIASGWGKPKPMKIAPDVIETLGDPTDRELCSLLLGAVWVTQHETAETYGLQRSHAMYRLARGAQRQLLRQLIATGRCFVETDEDGDGRMVPLHWDGEPEDPASTLALGMPGHRPPSRTWTLWLHGAFPAGDGPGKQSPEETNGASETAEIDEEDALLAELDAEALRAEAFADEQEEDADATPEEGQTGSPSESNGDLIVDAQVRRMGKRMSVAEPELILGGTSGLLISDGKVAEFDDREAYRWVSQFREGRYGDREGSKAMRIPQDDIARFLDRLYMLPNLPEIDLPEGLGRTEHRIEPRPHLEIHGPTSPEAAQLLSSPPGKSSLVARVWFDYGGQRVNPARPGRFVPITQPAATAEGGEGAGNTPATTSGADGLQPEADGATVAVATATPPEETPADDAPREDDAATSDAELEAIHAGRLIRRNQRTEREAIAVLPSLGLRHVSSATGDVLVLPAKQMPFAASVLLARGWDLMADRKLVRSAGPPALSITSGIDWFELRGTVKFIRADGQEELVSLPAILRAARAGQSMIQLGDGSQGLLPEQWLQEHGLLTAMGELEGDHLRFQQSQAALLDTLLTQKDGITVDDRFAAARERLAAFDGIEEIDASPDFGGQLRSYQRQGLGWFAFLRHFGMGGILADDMGLGKTVQVLAMIQARRQGLLSHRDPLQAANAENALPRHPALIVVPRSVIFNWLDEASRFTPKLKVLAYSGPDRESELKRLDEYDLVVTSYGLMRRDIEAIQNQPFDYVVLDEAQAIKNPASQSAKAARLLKATHRLALTGTPVENHLGDLWSIYEFLNPGMLGSNARFAELIRTATTGRQRAGASIADGPGLTTASPSADAAADFAAEEIEEDSSENIESLADARPDRISAITQIAQALRPFILRRTKTQVLTDLPRKTEQTIICEMEPAQRKVYDALRQYYRGTLLKQLDAASTHGSKDAPLTGGRSAFMVLEALLRLRQAACHPALIHKEGIALPTGTQDAPSAKLDVLDQRLSEIIDEGSKVLVFSQFTSMLALVRKRLDAQGIRYAYLDGQTRNRREVVERFQEDPELQVFLISLKAGGVGLNLTAAEYVFILDPWWNPAVEAQAIDRTHRIGQTRPVFAYRLICEETVEQRILALQDRKRQLADAIVGGGEHNLLSTLTREDLEHLLS